MSYLLGFLIALYMIVSASAQTSHDKDANFLTFTVWLVFKFAKVVLFYFVVIFLIEAKQ